eukprot:TRINITY_DN2734_c0_g1_i1.p1 TRINITY_DN2734_c0_g1~~TRINITY_DN2734_c0_g1_i1.p1  ORF type:complete len:153 (+),score=27.36 TRINITY_DN2734_c0_g1_i1:41-460(+)
MSSIVKTEHAARICLLYRGLLKRMWNLWHLRPSVYFTKAEQARRSFDANRNLTNREEIEKKIQLALQWQDDCLIASHKPWNPPFSYYGHFVFRYPPWHTAGLSYIGDPYDDAADPSDVERKKKQYVYLKDEAPDGYYQS